MISSLLSILRMCLLEVKFLHTLEVSSLIMLAGLLSMALFERQLFPQLQSISVATGGQLGAIAPPTVIRSTPEIRANPKSLGGGGWGGG